MDMQIFGWSMGGYVMQPSDQSTLSDQNGPAATLCEIDGQ